MAYNKAAMDRYRATENGRQHHAQDARNARLRAKLSVIDAYGGQCVCCQETELVFLTIDHINGGGNQMRTSTARYTTDKFYRQLKRDGFPEGFRVLCFNCNWAEAHGGCPHGRATFNVAS